MVVQTSKCECPRRTEPAAAASRFPVSCLVHLPSTEGCVGVDAGAAIVVDKRGRGRAGQARLRMQLINLRTHDSSQ